MTEESPLDAALAKIGRIERRLAREKAARVEAEEIAERGLRQLYEANQGLDAKVRERTAELDEALNAAERASTAKSAFLEHITHEVKTPLNGVLGMTELIAGSDISEQQHLWLDSLTESAARLQRLFQRLLLFVDMEGSDLTPKATSQNVEGFLDDVAARWRTPAAKAGQLLMVESSVGSGQEMLITLEEMHTVLDEVLDNVVRYADPGPVTIKAWADEAGGNIVLQVCDNGPGLIDTFLDYLSPTDATHREGGQGLGLAIAERILTALDGQMNVDSEGAGTAATIRVPAQPA